MNGKLDENFIINLSKQKKEPKWMTDFRLLAYHEFLKLDNPDFGPEINLDFSKINYFKGEFKSPSCNWEKINPETKDTFNKLGVIDAEKKYLGGGSYSS